MATYEAKFNLGHVGQTIAQAAHMALGDAAEHLLAEANKKVPIDEGTLERSGKASVNAAGTEATVSYNVPYAAYQHEDLTLRHKNGRQAKFLESAMNEEQSTIAELIADRIGRAIK